MRYTGGVTGGSWITALTSDLGAGRFDGAWLVQNFENLNPSNTFWSKPHNLYAKIDTEARRYLGFERWWGGHVNLNAEEIQFIVDELFIGNNLAAGRIQTSDGVTIDLRNIRSPIVVFCSKGDNIAPPRQALDWILDLYDDVEQMRCYGQTIVYTIHESIGHLGIFVSGGVARKEHGEFSSNIDMIEILPPGLYEAVFDAKTADTSNPDLVTGDWVMRCETRTLDDIRALGGYDPADERRFATAARVSEINLALYRTFAQPIVRALTPKPIADLTHEIHPLRLQYEWLSDENPQADLLAKMAEQARQDRKPARDDNPFTAFERMMSGQIVAGLDMWRDMRDTAAEWTFLFTYGNPWLQAMTGVDPKDARPKRRAGENPLQRQLIAERIAELKSRIKDGGLREATVRAMLYISGALPGVDERGLAALRRTGIAGEARPRMTLSEFKAMVREQYYMLLIDQDAALAAIPGMLPDDSDRRRNALATMREILSVSGQIPEEAMKRFNQIGALFGVEGKVLPGPSPRRSKA